MHRPNRRDILKATAALGSGFWLGATVSANTKSANEKLNIACIGVGGRGGANVEGVMSQNVVALCDVDSVRAGKTRSRILRTPWFLQVVTYRESRRQKKCRFLRGFG